MIQTCMIVIESERNGSEQILWYPHSVTAVHEDAMATALGTTARDIILFG